MIKLLDNISTVLKRPRGTLRAFRVIIKARRFSIGRLKCVVLTRLFNLDYCGPWASTAIILIPCFLNWMEPENYGSQFNGSI